VYGDDQNDAIFGGTGNDILGGGFHNDTIHGGPGDDILMGGETYDRLHGDPGSDICLDWDISVTGCESSTSGPGTVGRQLITIGFNPSTSRFHGIVTSPAAGCRSDRTVQLSKNATAGPALVGMATTGPQGGWGVGVADPQGHYFALAPKQDAGSASCPRARSRLIRVT
jgi:Ca2+-binding RTX toxin-like protein